MREIVVTGGGTGIGYAVAAAFVAQGDRVTIAGRREHVLKEAADRLDPGRTGLVAAVAFNAANPVAVGEALDRLPSRVDVLVNNAGGNTDLDRPADDGDLMDVAEGWWANLNANLMSAVLVTSALIPRLADDGRIVTIGSIAARGTGSGSYGAAKAAVEAWTADLAAELGPRGVTANVVSPGLVVDTEFFRGRLTEEGVRRRVENTRNGRAGTPEDVAETVRFLASPQARHLTGQVVHVNGGAYLGR
ncbi:SDR family oxidoreductase [Planomonospora sp. ID91781]|uniref:3-oxoacyl-ACP reductase n=3 Tax=Planomonospora TaxID=1998 RepID=A0A171BGT2_9ACTN|nr:MULTISPECIES: SDR family oxidoreductase [Planomonospora]MBG0820859.1 SDR family oxidoreductase [Planomonospora sp. ID91781]GAT65072.1 3-oxoacyl-ACP reductase [Planomonospora sphaerica]GGK59223.1 3-oxoacyl-ACP reductase [Planomonospora parontospora]GII08001.1 3-oxoacyl-ACP reductase [Planomonospora parontospora subsp. parontospora]